MYVLRVKAPNHSRFCLQETSQSLVCLNALVHFVVFACGEPENTAGLVGVDTWVTSLQRAEYAVELIERRHHDYM